MLILALYPILLNVSIGKKNNMTNEVGDWENDIDYINDYISSGKIYKKY